VSKIALVTGATAGIGHATATALAAQGWSVIVAGRNREKAERTVQSIRSGTGSDAVQYVLGDFSDLDQVRAMAAAVQEQTERLDVLVNNAGAFYNARLDTPYGVERTFIVNYLAPFTLTHLLLPALRASAPARIVNVSSEAHRSGRLDLDDLGFERRYMGFKAYARSKLALVIWSHELARCLEGTGVTVNALHPGHVATSIFKVQPAWVGRIVQRVMARFSERPEEAAARVVYLATSAEVEGATGKYFVKGSAVESAPLSYDEEAARRLWQASERLAGIRQRRSRDRETQHPVPDDRPTAGGHR
jgi:NAD(P)-dependent dehydrogenase (short-subunit alcohol dehydrogenase family)